MKKFMGLKELEELFEGLKPEDIRSKGLEWCQKTFNLLSDKVDRGHIKDEGLFSPNMIFLVYAIALEDVLEAQGQDFKSLVNKLIELSRLPKWKRIDIRMANSITATDLLKKERVSADEIGKFFVFDEDEKVGQFVTLEELQAMNIDDIGGWYRIGQLDVNC